MKNILRIFTIIILLAVALFFFKNIKDKSQTREDKSEIIDIIEKREEINDERSEHSSENEENNTKTETSKEDTAESDKEILKLTPSDMYLGDKNAPIVMIEYDSLTCPHCQVFYKTIFPTIKTDYIDKGKVFYISRSFPTDGICFKFSLMMECLDKVEDKSKIREIIFNKQRIIFDKLGKLNFKDQSETNKKKIDDEVENVMNDFLNMFSMQGLDKDKLKSCGDPDSSEERKQKLLDVIKLAHDSKYKINATPSFIVNGKKHDGTQNLAFWKKIIDEEILAASKVNEIKKQSEINTKIKTSSRNTVENNQKETSMTEEEKFSKTTNAVDNKDKVLENDELDSKPNTQSDAIDDEYLPMLESKDETIINPENRN